GPALQEVGSPRLLRSQTYTKGRVLQKPRASSRDRRAYRGGQQVMPSSPAAGTASDTLPDPGAQPGRTGVAAPAPQAAPPERSGRHAGASLSVADHVPVLLPGVELVGEYQGSGLAEATYLVQKPGGQAIQVSRLLYLVLGDIDGIRTVSEIAGRVSAAFGRTVSADNVGYLLASKFAPLGLVPGG